LPIETNQIELLTRRSYFAGNRFHRDRPSKQSGENMLVLIIGLVVFLGVHLIRTFAPDWREAQIARMGEGRWKGIYSLVSIASLILIIYGYYLARPDAVLLYAQFGEMYHAVLAIMAFSLVLIVAADLPVSHMTKKFRHPMLLGTILWSISHLWMNGDSASVVLFGSFLVWAILVLRSSVARPKVEKPTPRGRFDLIAIAVGAALFALIWWKLHEWLIGVAPIV
jgi:uncharacterized membrane protein